MLYFIPAWYLKDEWKEDEQFWYRRRMKTETDDTVKQIQLFQRNSICEYKILLLSYAPNFRHFLHRQSAFRVPYWSVFDAIQEVRRKKQAILSFHNLNWPRDIELVYTPFSIIAMLNQERYAKVEFGEYGNLIQIDLYRDGQVSRKNIYDDRGFISCTSVYENGRKAYDQYLTEKGVWKLCHFADGHVVVNPRSSQYLIHTPAAEQQLPFAKSTYGSMEEVIEEVFGAALGTTQDTDIFCAAVHQQHLALLGRLLAGRKTIFSVFEERALLDGNRAAAEILSRGNYIVTDSEENLAMVSRQKGLEQTAKKNIPPYDTRMEPGISQQINVQKILFPVDRLTDETLETAVRYMAAYLEENRNARVHLFTRNAEANRKDMLLKQIGAILERNGYPSAWAGKGNRNQSENLLDEEDWMPVLFIAEQCVDELSVNKCVREQRLLVDLADTPDLFLQILCVGMGIPQILRTATQYMRPGENGRINKDLPSLGKDLKYYLESLGNWNEAMIRSYELGKTHTTQYLIKQWKEVIKNIGNSTGITAGNRKLQ
ncbi:MAG: accessory Sec system protein Asp1 [Lachnospiraceae bacterium]|jgi:accessory secretory protein Asp1|nr:accessory Sec system protein Asp1 [Lachnospiraceae bacterium]